MKERGSAKLHRIAIADLACLIGFVIVSMTSVVPEIEVIWNITWITLLSCSILCSCVLVYATGARRKSKTAVDALQNDE